MIQDLPFISIVVIGYNEARNLHNTFSALRNMNYPSEKLELIYVDSGSTDGSKDIAGIYCHKVFEEHQWPSAARNRNRGLIESSHDICHFLDGDIVIDPDYIKLAIEKLEEGTVHAVFGFLTEKSNSGLNKILLHDYSNRKPGFINAPGAGGTFLKKALLDINGWDERIPRGEEMEIGERLINAGYRIWFLESRMGVHDFGITGFYNYLKKQITEGESIGKVSLIPADTRFFKHIRRMAERNFIFHILLLLFISITIVLRVFWIVPIALLFYLAYLFVKYRFIRGIKNNDSIIYHFLQNLSKSFKLFGFFKFKLQYSILKESEKAGMMKRIDINSLDNTGITK